MPYSKDHKHESRIRILESAFALFTQKGFEVTTIDEVMAGANMTRGAFYAHFPSKSQLYQAALVHAAEKTRIRYSKPEKTTEKSWMKVLLRGYLHEDHIQQKNENSCPLAFLVTDVAIREGSVRSAYTDAFRNMTQLIGRYAQGAAAEKKNVMAATSMLIGAVAVARALDDEVLVGELLDNCKAEAMRMLGDG